MSEFPHFRVYSKLLLIFIVSASLIWGYKGYRSGRSDYKDPLETKLAVGDIDGWSITHFSQYALIGYICPYTGIIRTAFLVAVAWESFEFYLEHTINDSWWYAKVSDLAMNGIGLGAGYALSKGKRR